MHDVITSCIIVLVRTCPNYSTWYGRPKAFLLSEEMYGQLLQGLGVQAFKTENLPGYLLQTFGAPLNQEEFEAGGIQQAKRQT